MNFYCSHIEKNLDFNLQTIKSPNSDWFLYLDDGWTINKDHVYKGIESNWCRIDFAEGLRITTNKLRDFPLYYNDTCVSNFLYTCGTQLPTDGTIYWNKNKKPIVSYNTNFYPTTSEKHLTFNECNNILFESLVENIETFAKQNSKPIYIPFQYGIDSLTIRSVFDFLKIDYELFVLPKTKPTLSKLGNWLSKKYWGFAQINEIKNAVVVTGFHGDEWVLRNPYYVHALLSQRNISITEEFDKIKDCYMKQYFENYRTKCNTKCDLTIESLMSQICNDLQIWHLNNTYFLSPLKHKNLLQLLRADTNTIIEQATDATLSKSIIENCNRDNLKLLDDLKNQDDPNWFSH